jgi:hypothetical protein
MIPPPTASAAKCYATGFRRETADRDFRAAFAVRGSSTPPGRGQHVAILGPE